MIRGAGDGGVQDDGEEGEEHRFPGGTVDKTRRAGPSSLPVVILSTLLGCLHLGLIPTNVGADAVGRPVFSEVQVLAPVAEPGVDEAMKSDVTRDLAARGALGGDAPLVVTITEAALDPAMRAAPTGPGGGIWYHARLVARVDRGPVGRTFSVEDWVGDTGQIPDRKRIFDALSQRMSEQIGGWATSPTP